MHSKDKGDLAEYKVIAKCLERGWAISKTIGDNQPYDLIIDRDNGKLERVQVKNGNYKTICIKIECKSCGYKFKDGKPIYFTSKYDPQDIELFASYCRELDKVYLLPNNKLKSGITLWLETPKNNCPNILYAKDFEI